MSQYRVVIIEDDKPIADLIEFNLKSEDYDTYAFSSGDLLFYHLAKEKMKPIDLFIIDIMLPDIDGFKLCEKIKQDPQMNQIPIMMLTARHSEQDKVKAFNLGADDYLTKPFGIREFLARVKALIRRYKNTEVQQERPFFDKAIEQPKVPLEHKNKQNVIEYFNIKIDDTKHRVYKNNVELDMTNREYELLKFLMLHRGIAYSRDDLLNYVWAYDYSGETRTVDVHIRQLRRKIEEDSNQPVLIETVRGHGYRFKEA